MHTSAHETRNTQMQLQDKLPTQLSIRAIASRLLLQEMYNVGLKHSYAAQNARLFQFMLQEHILALLNNTCYLSYLLISQLDCPNTRYELRVVAEAPYVKGDSTVERYLMPGVVYSKYEVDSIPLPILNIASINLADWKKTLKITATGAFDDDRAFEDVAEEKYQVNITRHDTHLSVVISL